MSFPINQRSPRVIENNALFRLQKYLINLDLKYMELGLYNDKCPKSNLDKSIQTNKGDIGEQNNAE